MFQCFFRQERPEQRINVLGLEVAVFASGELFQELGLSAVFLHGGATIGAHGVQGVAFGIRSLIALVDRLFKADSASPCALLLNKPFQLRRSACSALRSATVDCLPRSGATLASVVRFCCCSAYRRLASSLRSASMLSSSL